MKTKMLTGAVLGLSMISSAYAELGLFSNPAYYDQYGRAIVIQQRPSPLFAQGLNYFMNQNQQIRQEHNRRDLEIKILKERLRQLRGR